MVALEREGYLVQPHTSAGRIPTDKGYRFFVDHLTEPGMLGPAQHRKVSTFFDQVHLEMDGNMRLAEAHRIADEVEAALVKEFPNTEVIIHQDPAGIEEPRQALQKRAERVGTEPRVLRSRANCRRGLVG